MGLAAALRLGRVHSIRFFLLRGETTWTIRRRPGAQLGGMTNLCLNPWPHRVLPS